MRSGGRARVGLRAALVVAACAMAAEAASTGGYRGPQNNGVFQAEGLLRQWPPGGPPLLWKQPVGIGFAGAAVVDDRVYIAGGRPTTRLLEFDLEGRLLKRIGCGPSSWKRFTGMRSVPLVVGDVVITAEPNADLYASDLITLTTRWKKNAWKDFGTGEGNMGWGLPETPMLLGDKVAFNACSRNNGTPPIVAVHAATGEIAWQMDPETDRKFSAADCSGAVFTHNGRRLLAYPVWRSFVVLDAETGLKLWEFPDPAGSEKTLAPAYNEGYLLTMPQGSICRMVRLSEDGASYEALWERPFRGQDFSQAVILDGRVWMFGDAGDEPTPPTVGSTEPPPRPKRSERPAILCLDAETGRVIQSYPSAEPGHVIAADGLIVTVEKVKHRASGKAVRVSVAGVTQTEHEGGITTTLPRVRLLRPCPAGFEVTGEFIPDLTDEEIALRDVVWEANANPTITEGRLFLRYGPLLCYDLRADPPSSGFRGDGSGAARFARPPVPWDAARHTLWDRTLPEADGSPPAVADGRAVVICGAKLLCLDAATGQTIWQIEGGRAQGDAPQPTPLIRDGRVYAAFTDGTVLGAGLDGKTAWSAAVEPPEPPASVASPLVADGVLVVQAKALTGLSLETGSALWQAEAPAGAVHGSPVRVYGRAMQGRSLVATSWGLVVRASDGRAVVRWKEGDRNNPLNAGPASPVAACGNVWWCGNLPEAKGGFVYRLDTSIPEKELTRRRRLDTKMHKDVAFAVRRRVESGLCPGEAGSPLAVGDRLYALAPQGDLVTMDAAGAVLHRTPLLSHAAPQGEANPGKAVPALPPSALLAATHGLVWAFNVDARGRTVVLRDGAPPEKVFDNPGPGEPVAPAFAGDRLYVRAGKRLWCIADPGAEAARLVPRFAEPAAPPAANPPETPPSGDVAVEEACDE